MSENLRIEDQRHSCFLSLPHKFETVRDSLKAMVKRIGGDSYFVIVSEGDTLRNEIKRALGTSSILIADLSSPPSDLKQFPKGPRPAIMWEIGYADALGLGLVFLCQNKDKPFVPSVLADYHTIYYDINNISGMIREAEGAVSKLIARGRPKESRLFRSICYVDRKSADLEVRYLKAKDTIKILELNLETVEEQVPTIIRALQDPGNLKLSVQIMTLNPFSKFAADRALQLGQLPLPYRRKLFDNMKGTHDKLSQISAGRWELRIFDTFPTQIMFQIDESFIHSMISLGKRSRTMLHFEVQKGQPNASDTFEAHFNQLWSGSLAYPVWYQQNETAVRELLGPGRLDRKDQASDKSSLAEPSEKPKRSVLAKRPRRV